MIENSAEAGKNYVATLKNVSKVVTISSSHIAVVHRKNNKSAVALMRHNSEEIESNIELDCENEVSCYIATSKYILIGISEPNPRLLIYDLH